MDPDLLMTVGVVLGVFTIPSLFSAFVEGRPPRVGAIFLLTAGALIATALVRKPGGYDLAELPGVMVSVLGRYIN